MLGHGMFLKIFYNPIFVLFLNSKDINQQQEIRRKTRLVMNGIKRK